MASRDQIGYGLVGFGGIAEARIAKEGFGLGTGELSPFATLFGATDIAGGRRAAAERLNLRWFADIDELLAVPEIDAVVIATNNSMHAPLAERALRAGKHCLIEKPMGVSGEETRSLCELAGSRGLSVSVDHMMRYNGHNRAARDYLREGKLGEIHDIDLHMEFLYGATEDEARSWRCHRPEELGGPLGDIGSHCLYMAEFLVDSRITEIACSYTPPSLALNVESGAVLRLKFANGASGSIRVAFDQRRGTERDTLNSLGYEVYAERGMLRGHCALHSFSGHGDESVPVRVEAIEEGTDVPRTLVPDACPNIYKAVVETHAKSILDASPMSGAEGLWNVDLILAAHRSAQNGSLPIQTKWEEGVTGRA